MASQLFIPSQRKAVEEFLAAEAAKRAAETMLAIDALRASIHGQGGVTRKILYTGLGAQAINSAQTLYNAENAHGQHSEGRGCF